MDDVRFRVNKASGVIQQMQTSTSSALPVVTFFGNPDTNTVHRRLSAYLRGSRGICPIPLSEQPHLQLLIQPDDLMKIPSSDRHSPPRTLHPCAMRTGDSDVAMSPPQRSLRPDIFIQSDD